jgi:hypothetical protein
MMSPAIKQSAQRKAYLNADIVAPAQGLNGRGGILVEDGWIWRWVKSLESIGAGTASFDCEGEPHSGPHRHACLLVNGTEYRETCNSVGRGGWWCDDHDRHAQHSACH